MESFSNEKALKECKDELAKLNAGISELKQEMHMMNKLAYAMLVLTSRSMDKYPKEAYDEVSDIMNRFDDIESIAE